MKRKIIGPIMLAALCLFVNRLAQAADDDIHFAADLTPDEETMAIESPASGHVDLWLERATLKITWRITYDKLSDVATIVGLYGPAMPSFNAGLQLDLGKPGAKSPVSGSAILNDGQFQYLITSKMFVNILTRKFPSGELRGQLERTRDTPKAPA